MESIAQEKALRDAMQEVNHAIPKKDAYPIMTGAPVYTEDLVPADALVVKLLRSPHAHARVLAVHKAAALAVPGVVCVLDKDDVPRHRHSYAGESFPGNNVQDRLILDDKVRYVGDPVAIVAAKTEAAADKAISLITVDYDILPAVLDFEHAEEEGTAVVHDEPDFGYQFDVGGDLAHNVMSSERDEGGDFEAVYAACPVQMDETYRTIQNQQAMMETFRAFSRYDEHGRLTITASTQVPFHVRRVVATALGIPQYRVRCVKPRIGGGFGAKQSLCAEVYPAVVTYLTGKPAYLQFTRTETFCCGNTRHAFRLRVRLGAERDGTVKALWIDSLMNVGAYGEHAVNVVGLSGHKTLPLYARAEAWRYTGKTIYTNTTPGGAFRGFGATQGCYAIETTVNKMCEQLGLDPTEVRLKNLPRVGEEMPAYYHEPLQSCALDRCIKTGREQFGWDEKFAEKPFARKAGPHRYRGAGMAIIMQGSGLSGIDTCSATIRLEDSGFYTLGIGAADMGTGCDTILAQMAAEVLECPTEKITVSTVDTAHSPYDKGSYASSTTYVTGNAVVLAAKDLRTRMLAFAAEQMHVSADAVVFDGELFTAGERQYSLVDMSYLGVNGFGTQMIGTGTFCGKTSPPPFVAGFAEVEVDTETGLVTPLDVVGVVDCGTVVNKALARVQAEGGFAQGIGMALYENAVISSKGSLQTNNFMTYKIPARTDLPPIRIFFEESYEPSGPFGAKSIGEVVINTPTPAIISAIRNAVGAEIRALPATAERVYEALQQAGGEPGEEL